MVFRIHQPPHLTMLLELCPILSVIGLTRLAAFLPILSVPSFTVFRSPRLQRLHRLLGLHGFHGLHGCTTTRTTMLEARLLQSSNGLDFGGPDSWIVVDFRRAAVLPDFFLLMDFQ